MCLSCSEIVHSEERSKFFLLNQDQERAQFLQITSLGGWIPIHVYPSSLTGHKIGVDFALKVINWDSDTLIRLQLWDIAGNDAPHRAISPRKTANNQQLSARNVSESMFAGENFVG